MLARQTILESLNFDLSILNDQQIHNSDQAPYRLSYGFANGVEPADLAGGYDGWRALTDAERAVIREALTEIETLINVTFTDVTGASDPDISLGKVTLSGNVAGYGGLSYQTLDGVLSAYDGFAVFDTDVTQGRDVVMHELGHALALSHSFESPALPATYENNKYTVMSYTANPDTGADAQGMMLFDILALQARWGANLSHATGDNIYSGPVNDLLEVIWDAGGTDRLDASARRNDAVLDLREGSFSRFGAEHDDMAIAFDVQIENALGGSGNDRISGNGLNNWMAGNAGADSLVGGSGNDLLAGNTGQDTIWGQTGDDIVQGGYGDDLLGGGSGDDSISGWDGDDTAYGGDGSDTIWGQTGNDTIYAHGDNDLAGGGDGDDMLWGGGGVDTLYGGTGSDEIYGQDGNDLLHGQQEADRIGGGVGNDTIWAGFGNDLVFGGNDDDLIGGWDGNDTVWGEAGNDNLQGQRGDDWIGGGDGDDTLHGGYGDDRLWGGAGADLFVFNLGDGADVIEDFQDGIDRILLSSASESLTLAGSSAVFTFTDGSLTIAGNFLDLDQAWAVLQDDVLLA